MHCDVSRLLLELQGCVGLVTPGALDVLSHAAVRARNGAVLLASCSDTAALQRLRALAGRSVELSISPVGRPYRPSTYRPFRHTAAANECTVTCQCLPLLTFEC